MSSAKKLNHNKKQKTLGIRGSLINNEKKVHKETNEICASEYVQEEHSFKSCKENFERSTITWWIHNQSERFYRTLIRSSRQNNNNNIDELNWTIKDIIKCTCLQFCPQESEYKDFSQEVRNTLYGSWYLVTSVFWFWPNFLIFYFQWWLFATFTTKRGLIVIPLKDISFSQGWE